MSFQLTFVIIESSLLSAGWILNSDDVGDGIGVFASFSNEFVLFLTLRLDVGGEGGGLGGKRNLCCCSYAFEVAMVLCIELIKMI